MTTVGYALVPCICVLLTLLLALWIAIRLLRRIPPYPPGPKALPIIANALDMPRRDFGRYFAQMIDKYGELDVWYSYGSAARPVLILET